jgi:hypothetical protein
LATGAFDRLAGQFILGGERFPAGTLHFDRHEAKANHEKEPGFEDSFCIAAFSSAIEAGDGTKLSLSGGLRRGWSPIRVKGAVKTGRSPPLTQ